MISLFDVVYDVNTSGPGSRTEVFFAGCSKAMSGKHCKHCFNTKLWNIKNGKKTTAHELSEHILNNTTGDVCNVTFCGGEPTDQLTNLITTCKLLKNSNRKTNILVYTYHNMDKLINKPDYRDLFLNIDLLVDGPYDERYRIYDNKSNNWVKRSIGSFNQRVYKINHHVVAQYDIDKNGDLKFNRKLVI